MIVNFGFMMEKKLKKYLSILMLLCTVFLYGCPLAPGTIPTQAGKWHRQEQVSGASYWMYLPKNYNQDKPMKVIISCHGTPPWDVAKHHIDTWGQYGDQYGCLVLCPELSGTDGIFGAGSALAMLEDERRILSILSTLSYQYNIDGANIMLTGFSGGGFPVYWVGLRHPDLFSVLIAQNSNFNEGNTDQWYPVGAQGASIFIYYGSADPAPIKIQSENGIDYLRSKGFKVDTLVLTSATHDRIGHDRHPEIAMAYFKKNWRTPRGTLMTPSHKTEPNQDPGVNNVTNQSGLNNRTYIGGGAPPPLP